MSSPGGMRRSPTGRRRSECGNCENGSVLENSHVNGVAQLSKHHGLGNDFLVWLTPELPVDPHELARRWCDRRVGIGADGLLFGLPVRADAGADIEMRLHNSDGSLAEISGNGLRCFAQAVARERGVDRLDLSVATAAGTRRCSTVPGPDVATLIATVDMGVVTAGPPPVVDDLAAVVGAPMATVDRWETADIGNPHVVCHVPDPARIDLAVAGPAIEAQFAGGVNVHFVSVTSADTLEMRVWERGAGITNACGTGATVSADVFHRWGLVGTRVRVRMPGGDAHVQLSGPLTLTGPATHVADLLVPLP